MVGYSMCTHYHTSFKPKVAHLKRSCYMQMAGGPTNVKAVALQSAAGGKWQDLDNLFGAAWETGSAHLCICCAASRQTKQRTH